MQKDTSLERSQMLLPHCKVALPPMQDRPLKQNKVALTLPIRPHPTNSPSPYQFAPPLSVYPQKFQLVSLQKNTFPSNRKTSIF